MPGLRYKFNTKSQTSHALRERFCLKTLTIAALLLAPSLIQAQIIVSEVMYDLAGTDSNEWIEVQNTSTQEIDLSTWKLFEGNSNHGLKIFQGNQNVPAGSFAIIADDPAAFVSEYAGFTGVIFDSSFSLSNVGETFTIRDSSLVDVDTFSYTSDIGSNGDGTSLQKISNEWKPLTPTPGVVNSLSSQQSSSSQAAAVTETTSISTYSTSAQESKVESASNFVVSIGKDRLAAVGNEVMFRAEVKNQNSYSGRGASFSWSMGDGSLKNGQVITYNYRYPGDYVVVLNASRGEESIVARVTVRVVEPEIEMTVLSDASVKVTNQGKDEINLHQWKIESLGQVFTFPQDTIIKGKSSIVIPSSALGIVLTPNFPIQVKNPLGVTYSYLGREGEILESKNLQPLSVELNKTRVEEEEAIKLSQVEEQIEGDPVSNSETLIESLASQPAATIKAVEIDKPKGFWSGFLNFFRRLFD